AAMAGRPLKAPQISEAEMITFHETHFSPSATTHFGSHFLQPVNSIADEGPLDGGEDEYLEDEDDGLGYYADGVKRTLTDEQIAIFRHSELETLRRARESTRIKRATHTVDHLLEAEISSAPTATPKKKKKRKRGKNKIEEEPIDLRKRTWDVVDKGLPTLEYGDEGNTESTHSNATQRRRVSYDD
ncbi:hypothetical protein B0H67DRAFT_478884, partial [Lasiosphaeris hirsuta]